ncbi:30S ribosomal protein S4 [Candidatus Woesearchaeota archaeon]|nr:30S ribosomal protein S4 [Candidatus Woesearchaeota archaeon]
MGDPRKTRSAYQGPRHPWNKERIDAEKQLAYAYGLSNKKELWKAESKLKHYKDNTKKLIAQTGPQAEKERQQLFKKLQRYGLVGADATADDVLGLETEQLLDRRLQTLVHKKELARTIKQARQFITHGHVMVNGRKVTVAGYLVPVAEEDTITFANASSLTSPDHPERVPPQKATGAGNKQEAKTKQERAERPEPVVATEQPKEEDKPVEQRIEEETDNAAEVAEAVEETEADAIAEDHEEATKEAAREEKKEDAQ